MSYTVCRDTASALKATDMNSTELRRQQPAIGGMNKRRGPSMKDGYMKWSMPPLYP